MNMRHVDMGLAFLFLFLFVAPATAADFTHNGITIICPWAEETRNGVTIAPVYMGIRASPQSGDELEEASTDLAAEVQPSTYTRVAGVLRRQRLVSIEVGAGQTIWLEPGGLHLLLVGLKEPLIRNTSFDMELEFDNAGEFEIEVEVVPIGTRPSCAPGGRPGTQPGLPVIPKGSF
jgi:copper(I)-binding protein